MFTVKLENIVKWIIGVEHSLCIKFNAATVDGNLGREMVDFVVE